MEEGIEVGLIKGSVDKISVEKAEKILFQMKNCICKINGNKIGTGFFCKILFEKKLIPVLMTNYQILNGNLLDIGKEINVYINGKLKIISINKDSIIYSSEEYDLVIIKVKENLIDNYLEIDQNIYTENSEKLYEDKTIYLLHYSNDGNMLMSFGYGIKQDNKYNIKHLCNADSCSSGGPILSLLTNKIIGIHKDYINRKGNNKNNIGTYLIYPLNDLSPFHNTISEIKLDIEIKKEDIKKDIYFLDNSDGHIDYKEKKNHSDNLKELNELNTELYINNKKYKYKKYFIPEKE